VLEPRTAYASEPPANWHAVRATRSFVLWQRSGPTAPRSVLDQAGAPGARLDCSRPPGSQIARQPGVAAIRAAPIVVAPAQLRLTSGRPVRISFFRFAQLHAGSDAVAHVAVPRGRFDASLQY